MSVLDKASQDELQACENFSYKTVRLYSRSNKISMNESPPQWEPNPLWPQVCVPLACQLNRKPM